MKNILLLLQADLAQHESLLTAARPPHMPAQAKE